MHRTDSAILRITMLFFILMIVGVANQAFSQEPSLGKFQVSTVSGDCEAAWVIDSSTGDLFIYKVEGDALHRKGYRKVPSDYYKPENTPPVGRFQIYPIVDKENYIWVLDTSTGAVHYFREYGDHRIEHEGTGKLPKTATTPTNVNIKMAN